jgi:hypothetical protein
VGLEPAEPRIFTHGESAISQKISDECTTAERRALLVRQVQELTRLIEAHGMMVTGSQGQPVMNPALGARDRALEAIRKLDLLTPPPDEPDDRDEFLRAND